MFLSNSRYITKLNERIGIDRSVLYNFDVVVQSLDTQKIENQTKQKKRSKSYTKIIYDDNSPLQLQNGRRIGKLEIKDADIGKLTLGFWKNNLSGSECLRSTLELMISKDNNNLQNLTTKEYQTRIADVFQMLENTYGIIVDYSNVKINKLELNATFYLAESYEKYKQSILLLIRNVPSKRYNNKYATWHELNNKANKDKLETALVKNSSIELKIYNKGKHLQDIGEIEHLENDIMRVEYTIKDKRILARAFGNNLVSSLSDEKINKLFKKFFVRDIVSRYSTWVAENHRQLVELTKKHREQCQKWTGNFFRECRQYAEENGLPLLFDIEDMRSVFQELEQKGSRNASRKFKKFKNQAIYEADLVGNTARSKEIMFKIMEM